MGSADGKCRDKVDAAGHLSVNRVWITKVIKKGSSKVTYGNLRGDAAEM